MSCKREERRPPQLRRSRENRLVSLFVSKSVSSIIGTAPHCGNRLPGSAAVALGHFLSIFKRRVSKMHRRSQQIFFGRKQDFLSPFLISKTCLMFTHFNIYTEAVYGASSTCCPPHPCHWFLSPINSSPSIFFSGSKIFWPFLIEIKLQTDAGRLNHRETPTTLHLVRICCADSSLATFLTVFFLVYTIKGK